MTRDLVFAFGNRVWNDAEPYGSAPPFSPHFMARRLVTDSSVDRLAVVDGYRSRLAQLKGRRVLSPGFPASSSRALLHPQRWRRFDATSRRQTIYTYSWLDRQIAAAAGAQGMRRPVLVTCHPVHAAVADRSRWADVVYYAWDDWLAYPLMSHLTDTTAWAYQQMSALDTNVVAVSSPLADRIGAVRSTVVPNGLSSSDFEDLPEPPRWFTALGSPVAFYAGALEQRVDLDAILDAAEALPRWSFVLVGPMRRPDEFAALESRPNIHVHPAVPHARVLSMARSAQVCLVPHRLTEMSISMSPLKLYEYVGAGTPVVAVDLPPIRNVSDRVLLVEPGAAYAGAIEAAAQLPPLQEPDLRAWRTQNDWDERYSRWLSAAMARAPGPKRLSGDRL